MNDGSGSKQGYRQFLDFVVDGASLFDVTSIDRIGFLGGWLRNEAGERSLLRQLLPEDPAELDTGRAQVCVCPIWGDIGCYAITAVVEEKEGEIVWRDFGDEKNWQYDDDDPLIERERYLQLGPFHFDKQQYRDALLNPPPKPHNPGKAHRHDHSHR